VEKSSGEILAFFDSDQWFTSSAGFEEALAVLDSNASIGAIGWGAGWFDSSRDDLGGTIVDYCENRAMNAAAVECGFRSDVGYLATSGLFVPRAVFDATHGFDTTYDPTCFEDTDLSFQIKRLGFRLCYRDLTGIRHQPHQTTKAGSGLQRYRELFRRNAEYFKEKWKEFPEMFDEYSP
jgi:GT2 family glycosyltransferase